MRVNPTEDHRSGDSGPIQLVLASLADALGVRILRTAVDTWLQRHFSLDDDLLGDIILATNEALANSAEHAYPNRHADDSIALHAVYDPIDDELTVIVSDRGRWRVAAPDPLSLRGRGIPLIHALTHHAEIDASATGTRVTLAWTISTDPPALTLPRPAGSDMGSPSSLPV